MFVDKDGSPTGGIMEHCDLCGFAHYDIETYRTWLLKYGGDGKKFLSSGKRNKAGQQIDRWREIVERHGTRRE